MVPAFTRTTCIHSTHSSGYLATALATPELENSHHTTATTTLRALRLGRCYACPADTPVSYLLTGAFVFDVS